MRVLFDLWRLDLRIGRFGLGPPWTGKRIASRGKVTGVSRWITLHDHLNPAEPVEVDADEINGVTGLGSGSSVHLKSGEVIGVHETPTEVRTLQRNTQVEGAD